jgi:hypothetical protein
MPRITAGCLIALALAAGACLAAGPWDPLLDALHLAPQTARLDPNRWTGGGEYRLDEFQRLWDDWQLVDPAARSWADEAMGAATSLGATLFFASPNIGTPLPPLPPPSRLKASQGRLLLIAAVSDLEAALGRPPDAGRVADLRGRVASVPPVVALAAAVVLRAVPEALAKRRQALEPFGGEAQAPAAYQAALKLAQQTDVDDTVLRLMAKVDLTALMAGGLNVAGAVDQAARILARPPSGEFAFEWDTPIGKIALNGSEANTYPAGAYLLAIDTGGDDRYGAGAGSTSPTTPVSVVVDCAGDDTYDSGDGFAVATGILGYAFLVDAGGNDTYHGGAGLGAGLFGVGMLLDVAGKDAYSGGQLAQGAGCFGVGALVDLAGDDSYHCLTQSQAYGAPKGVGLLVDREGNDGYEADDTNIVNPSPQTKDHNVSLAQGAGFGRRAHPGDGHSLAGGIGLLVDGAGDDHYCCGVFGQGVAYWYSTGFLVDRSGNDEYQGVWYVQGSSAHYAVAALCDLAGSDHYMATMTQSQGAGHDYSISLLHDLSGNDVYECPSNSLGVGLWNGIGLFRDGAGNDTYKTGAAALGYVGDSRPESSCLGLFLDEGGDDTLPADGLAKPHGLWVRPDIAGHPLAHAAGLDR